MKRTFEKLLGPSWRTTLLGLLCIIWGIRSACVLWVPYQSLYFNLLYVMPGPAGLIFAGWLGIHARDQKAHKDQP